MWIHRQLKGIFNVSSMLRGLGFLVFFGRPLTGEFKWVTNAACRKKAEDVQNCVLKPAWKDGTCNTQIHSWDDSFKMSVRIQYRDQK